MWRKILIVVVIVMVLGGLIGVNIAVLLAPRPFARLPAPSHEDAPSPAENPKSQTAPEAPLLAQGESGKEGAVSAAQAEEIAEAWVRASAPTYVFDGFGLVRKSVQRGTPQCADCYRVVFSFQSGHSGYGDRKDAVPAQVLTPHEIEVVVRGNNVIAAVTDGKYDELHGELLYEESPSRRDEK